MKKVKNTSLVATKSNTTLLKKLGKKVEKSSLNQVRKDLKIGSHNTVKRWFDVGRIPALRVDSVKKYLGV